MSSSPVSSVVQPGRNPDSESDAQSVSLPSFNNNRNDHSDDLSRAEHPRASSVGDSDNEPVDDEGGNSDASPDQLDDSHASRPRLADYRIVNQTTSPLEVELFIAAPDRANLDPAGGVWVAKYDIHLANPHLLFTFWADRGGRSHELGLASNDEFELFRICDHRGPFSRREFRVEWVGYRQKT